MSPTGWEDTVRPSPLFAFWLGVRGFNKTSVRNSFLVLTTRVDLYCNTQSALDEEVAYLEQQLAWLKETFGDLFDHEVWRSVARVLVVML